MSENPTACGPRDHVNMVNSHTIRSEKAMPNGANTAQAQINDIGRPDVLVPFMGISH